MHHAGLTLRFQRQALIIGGLYDNAMKSWMPTPRAIAAPTILSAFAALPTATNAAWLVKSAFKQNAISRSVKVSPQINGGLVEGSEDPSCVVRGRGRLAQKGRPPADSRFSSDRTIARYADESGTPRLAPGKWVNMFIRAPRTMVDFDA
jgi:hypothetical protein